MMYKTYVIAVSCLLVSYNSCADTSIMFPVGAYSPSKLFGNSFVVGAAEKGAQEYALAAIGKEAPVALAGEHITASNFEMSAEEAEKKQPNPLFDQPISHVLPFSAQRLIIASPSYPANLYLLDKKNRGPSELLVCTDIKDSQEDIISEIEAIAASDQSYIFAAVHTKNQKDGDVITEIALLQFQQQQLENKSIRFDFNQLSSNSFKDLLHKDSEPGVSFYSHVMDMWWDSTLKLLYIVVRSNANNGENSECYTVLSASIEEGKLLFNTVMPKENVTTDSIDEIPLFADHDFSGVYKVRTLHTSTKLSYLLVLDYTGNRERLLALPVCNTHYKKDAEKEQQFHGSLAYKDSAITSRFLLNNRVPSLQERYFEQPALHKEDIQTFQDSSVPIGGGSLKEGSISDIFVEGDAVYVAVASPTQNYVPGLFVSQPIFDSRGVITNWTSWQRVAGITKPVFSALLNYKTGNFMFLSGDEHAITAVQETQWSEGQESGFKPASKLLQEYFVAQYGGIYGCFDFSYKNAALLNQSFMVFTGYKKLALVQTGSIFNNQLQLPHYTAEKYMSDSGEFAHNIQEDMLLISGGALDELEMITAAECICRSSQGFLCVGGVKGLAVLMHKSGAGWHMGSKSSIGSLVADMAFKKIGNYAFVRKLMYDRGYLYVLTDTQLDRIDIHASSFIDDNLSVVTLATAHDFQKGINCVFTDCIVSEKLALLGTNKGLWRSGNDIDIACVAGKKEVMWQYHALLDGSDNIIQLRTVTASHQEQDCARGQGSMVYVLNGYYGHSVTYVHRFALQDTKNAAVAEDTFLPIPDYKIYQRFPYYHRYVGFKNQLGIEGAYCLTGQNCNRSGDCADDPVLGLTPAQGIGIDTPLVFSTQDEIISAIVRNSTSGNWIITGDFGLRLNE